MFGLDFQCCSSGISAFGLEPGCHPCMCLMSRDEPGLTHVVHPENLQAWCMCELICNTDAVVVTEIHGECAGGWVIPSAAASTRLGPWAAKG